MFGTCKGHMRSLMSHKVTKITQHIIVGFAHVSQCPSELLLYLEQLSTITASELLHFSDTLVIHLATVLPPSVPRRVTELMKELWVKLNTLMPRR
jgi:integrator complex subunit 2